MTTHEMTPEEEARTLADFDELAKKSPDYIAGAFTGMTMAWMYGFLADKPAKGNRLKYAAYGAGIYMLAQFAGHTLLKKTDQWAHGHPLARVRAPRTPVVTSGYFAGLPRPLYHAGAASQASSHYVGAPPADRDYSFTRRPGFNGKDY